MILYVCVIGRKKRGKKRCNNSRMDAIMAIFGTIFLGTEIWNECAKAVFFVDKKERKKTREKRSCMRPLDTYGVLIFATTQSDYLLQMSCYKSICNKVVTNDLLQTICRQKIYNKSCYKRFVTNGL